MEVITRPNTARRYAILAAGEVRFFEEGAW